MNSFDITYAIKIKLNKALLNVNCIADVLYGQNSMRSTYNRNYNMYQTFGQKGICVNKP